MTPDSNRGCRWNDQNESLLAKWGERSSVLRILHNRASARFRFCALVITVPTIVLSTVAATIQMRMSSMDHTGNAWISRDNLETILAAINMTIAMTTGLGSLLRFQERAELHKSNSSQFGNFYRNVSCELAFPRHEREDPTELLKVFKRQYDALLEGMPDIPAHLIATFKKQHTEKCMSIDLPDICNGLDQIEICKTSSFHQSSNNEEENVAHE